MHEWERGIAATTCGRIHSGTMAWMTGMNLERNSYNCVPSTTWVSLTHRSRKKNLHLGMWMHPATKDSIWSTMYVVIRTNQSKLCNDVQVVGRADCWSDHQMVGPNWTSNCHSQKALSFIWRRPMATSRCTFWLVLEKVGVPPKILNIITSIHDHMLAVVRVRNMTTESISVRTGSDRGAC